MAASNIKPGSKMSKAVKLLQAMQAVAACAPAGGPMDAELLAMHEGLDKRFNAIAEECGINEHALIMLCKTAME